MQNNKVGQQKTLPQREGLSWWAFTADFVAVKVDVGY